MLISELKNIIQLHSNDPHTHDAEGTEHYPERCNFRKINSKYCIYSLEQVRKRQIRMDPELYTKLVEQIKLKFRKTLNENIDNPLCTMHPTRYQ